MVSAPSREGAPVEGGVAGLALGEFQSVQCSAIAALQEEQIAGLVDDARW